MSEIEEKTEADILAFFQQELRDAIENENTPRAQFLQSELDMLEENLEQLAEAPLPEVPCRTCNGGPKLDLNADVKCASCGSNLNLDGNPSKTQKNVVDGVAFYPRDENDIPRQIGTGSFEKPNGEQA